MIPPAESSEEVQSYTHPLVKKAQKCLLSHEITWNANLMQQGNFINVFLARHVSGTYAHHQEYWMLSCSIWFSAPSFWMSGGLDSRCVGRVYGADGVVHHQHVLLLCDMKGLIYGTILELFSRDWVRPWNTSTKEVRGAEHVVSMVEKSNAYWFWWENHKEREQL